MGCSGCKQKQYVASPSKQYAVESPSKQYVTDPDPPTEPPPGMPNDKAPTSEDLVLSRYRLVAEEPLGEGGWCEVRAALDTASGEKRVAVKTFHQQALKEAGPDALTARFAHEVATFSALGVSHRHLAQGSSPDTAAVRSQQLFVNLLDFSGSTAADAAPGAAPDGRFYAILELADASLSSWLGDRAKKREFVSLEDVRMVALMLAESLSWMHGKGLCHLDVKPANIMRFGTLWKLIDLEGALPVSGDTDLTTGNFTPLYASPEVAQAVLRDSDVVNGSTTRLAGLSPSEKMDTWAAGVVLLDVLAHESVFQETWSGFQMQAMMDMFGEEDAGIGFQQEWYKLLADPAPIVPSDYMQSPVTSVVLLANNADLQDLLRRLLDKDPAKRLSSDEFLKHPFLTGSSDATPAAGEVLEGACPRCGKKEGVLCDVTVGATHESWGGNYTTCKYDCVICQKAISGGEKVDCCKICRCFWHRGGNICEKAAEPAALTL